MKPQTPEETDSFNIRWVDIRDALTQSAHESLHPFDILTIREQLMAEEMVYGKGQAQITPDGEAPEGG